MSETAPAANISIQTSTEVDFSSIAKQLKRSGSGFFGNINIIEKQHHKGQLLVAKQDDVVIGFLSYDDALSPCIMEVWEKYRKMGVGRRLYEGFVVATDDKREIADVMEVLCMPQSSMDFWGKMGFQKQYDDNGKKNKMFKLAIKPECFKKYEDIRVDIYRSGRDPVFSATGSAEINTDHGTMDVFLMQPMIFFYQGCFLDKSDIEVCVSNANTGEVLFKDYLLSENSEAVGIKAQSTHKDLFVFNGFEIYEELIYKPSATTRNTLAP